ncbi:DNA topoisomerase IB [Rhizobium sp. PAMB 3174]
MSSLGNPLKNGRKAISHLGLVFSSDCEPGISRRAGADGFSYHTPDGKRLRNKAEILRINGLAVPPAYSDVWICLDPLGHLQATGFDARKRKQYRYHPDWHEHRSGQKFAQLQQMGSALPRIRRRIARDLANGPDTEKVVLAALVMLLDLTHIRVGNERYAIENRTFGATTLEKRHLKIEDGRLKLRFVAKGGNRVQKTLKNRRLQKVLEEIADLPGRQLFAWRDGEGRRAAIDSGRLNDYLKTISGQAISAKSFRTWGGSVAAFGSALAALDAGERPTIKSLCEAAAAELHNTPAICRKSYVHPRVLALASGDADMLKRFRSWRGRRAKLHSGLSTTESLLLAFLRSRIAERV